MAEWKQYVYGKFTSSPEGAILPGKDYQCTGKSEGIPLIVQDAMRPTTIGPGVSDMTDWSTNPWNDEGGGYAVQSVLTDGVPWITACRVRGRSEGGEEVFGRMYVQGHYVAQSVEGYTPLSLRGLKDVLVANPMQELNNGLPELNVSASDHPLDEDWLAKISVLVVGLMSGIPIGIQASKLPLEHVFSLFQTLSCAVPPALSWRLSMQIGAMDIQEGVVVLAHGRAVHGGPRMLGFKWEEPPTATEKIRGIASARRHPRDSGYIGERYLQFLKEQAATVTTYKELRDLVCAHFPAYQQWDSQPLKMTFQELAVGLVENLIERDALAQLDRALKGTDDFPKASYFSLFQGKALQLVLPHALSSGMDFVMDILNEVERWKNSWGALEGDEAFYFRVLTNGAGCRLQDIDRLLQTEVPEALRIYVEQSLVDQMQMDWSNPENSEMWEKLYVSEKSQWLATWVSQQTEKLFWMSMRHRRLGNEALYRAGQGSVPWTYISRMQSGESIAQEEGQNWLEALPKEADYLEDLSEVIGAVMEQNVISGIEMMGWSDVELPLKERLMGPELHQWSAGPSAVKDIVQRLQSGMALQEITARIAFAFVKELSKEERATVIQAVQSDVSTHLSCALLGGTSGKSGRWDGIAAEMLLYRYGADSQFAEQMVSHCYEALSDVDRAVFKTFFLEHLSTKEHLANCTYGKVVQALMLEWGAPQISEEFVSVLSWLLTDIPLNRPTRFIKDPAALRALILAGHNKLELTSELLNCLLTADSRSFQDWQKIIEEQEWTEKDGWRILSRLGNNPKDILSPTKEEIDAIRVQSPERSLDFVHAGILLPSTGYDQIRQAFPVEKVLTEKASKRWSRRNLYVGLMGAMYSEYWPFVQYAVTVALKVLDDRDLEEQLREEYGKEKSFFGSLWSTVEQVGGDAMRLRLSKRSKLSRMLSSQIPEGEDLSSLLEDVFSSLSEEKRLQFFTEYS